MVYSFFAIADPMAAVHAEVLQALVKYGLIVGVGGALIQILKSIIFEKKRRERKRYYNEDYLESDAWKRKRFVVLRRDNWTCVYCGNKATDVHHKRYARQIGKEPIEWLVSVCPRCHAMEHPEKQAAQ